MYKMLKFCLCITFCFYIFLHRDANGKCSRYFKVKASLKYKSVGKYFSFTSKKNPHVNNMLNGSGTIFKGPAGKNVKVGIRGMYDSLTYLNGMINKY